MLGLLSSAHAGGSPPPSQPHPHKFRSLKGPLPRHGKDRSSRILGPCRQRRERLTQRSELPPSAILGWTQRDSTIFPVVSLLGSDRMPCLGPHWGSGVPFPHWELRGLEHLEPGPVTLDTPRGSHLRPPLGHLRAFRSCGTMVQSPMECTDEGTARSPLPRRTLRMTKHPFPPPTTPTGPVSSHSMAVSIT